MTARRDWAGLLRPILWAVLFLFALAPAPCAEPRTSIAVFDGGTPSVVSPDGADTIKASEAICLEFWIATDANAVAQPMPAIALVAADASWTLAVAADRKSISLADGSANPPTSVAVDLTGGHTLHLGFNFGPAGTQIFVDGLPLSDPIGPAFLPGDADETVQLRLGGPGFKGIIGSARLWSLGMNQALMLASRNHSDTFEPSGGLGTDAFVIGQVDGGQIARPAIPALGLWHENGAAANVPILKSLPGIPDVNHGQFADDEVFLSIFPSDLPFARYAFTTSTVFDKTFYLVPDAGLGAYIVEDQNKTGVAAVTFRPSGKAFLVTDAHTDVVPLRIGRLYKTLEVPTDGDQAQAYGEAWQVNDKPKNFEHSVIGCYSGVAMNMFDFQEHGCVRRLFREPPADSHRFDTGRNNLTIPWGWTYTNFSETRAHGFSAMASTSSDVGDTVSGGSGYHFSLAGVSYQNNTTTEQERQDIRARKAMRAYHQFVARRHSLVVDAKKMMLDQCFLRDIARLTTFLTGKAPEMPAYFDPYDTSGGQCDALIDDPLPMEEFVRRYADLYAYAITYGARAIQRVDMTTNTVANLAKNATNVSKGLEYAMKGSFAVPGTGISGEFKLGAGISSESGQAQWNQLEKEASLDFDELICIGGTSCANAQVEVGDNPVPIYLDLRPITDLLGPPYFADPAVTVTARRQLRDRLARIPKPKLADIPLMRVFDVGISNLTCGAVALTNTAPLVSMQQGQIGAFVTGARFGALTPPTPVPTTDNHQSSGTAAVIAYVAANCPTTVAEYGALELVAEPGANGLRAGPAHILAMPGENRAPNLSDMLNGKTTRILAEMFDAALGGGPETHPGLYPRLRSGLDHAKGNDDCPAPCGFAFYGYNFFSGVPAPQPDYIVYPSFEAIDLATLPKGGGSFGVVVARGTSNLVSPAAPAVAYWITVTLTLKEVTDLARAIGY